MNFSIKMDDACHKLRMNTVACYEHSTVCMLSESRKANEARWRMGEGKQRICISNETFWEWRQLHESYAFQTIYSLTLCYRIVLHMNLSLLMEN